MPKFFNRTRGPLAVELAGQPVLVGPKQTVSIPAGTPVTASLASMLRKGFLVLMPVDDAEQPAPAVETPEPAAVPAPAVEAETTITSEVTAEPSEPAANTESSTSDFEVDADAQTDLASEEISAIDTPQRRRKRSS